jgi:hypothetical protein
MLWLMIELTQSLSLTQSACPNQIQQVVLLIGVEVQIDVETWQSKRELDA